MSDDTFDYPIKSFSFLKTCGTETNDFALSITYPSNYTLNSTNNPTVTFAINGTEVSPDVTFKSEMKNNNIQIWNTDNSETIPFGYYTVLSIKEIKDDNTKSFNYKQITYGYCHSNCCIKNNIEQKVLIDKDDKDKLIFMLNLDGDCTGYKDSDLEVTAVKGDKKILLGTSCKMNTTANFVTCSLTETDQATLIGGEDRDKAESYAIFFKSNECSDLISTKITLDVVAGNYISLNRYSLVISLLIFFFIL